VVFLIAPNKASSGPKRFSARISQNNYLKTLILSVLLAFFLVFAVFGMYGLISGKTISSFIPLALVFLIFAILFVIGYEFFNSRLARKSAALLVGFLAAFVVTVLILALVEFAVMAAAGDIFVIGWEKFVIAVAFGIIVSVIILKYAENF